MKNWNQDQPENNCDWCGLYKSLGHGNSTGHFQGCYNIPFAVKSLFKYLRSHTEALKRCTIFTICYNEN